MYLFDCYYICALGVIDGRVLGRVRGVAAEDLWLQHHPVTKELVLYGDSDVSDRVAHSLISSYRHHILVGVSLVDLHSDADGR